VKKSVDRAIDTANVSDKPGAVLAPQGIGMAVAFDWGLTVQLLTMPLLPLIFNREGALKRLPVAGGSPLLSFALSIPAALLFAILGEGLRRGWRWTRPVQIVFNSAGFLGGFFSLYSLWQESQQGNYWPTVGTVILLIFSPLIAWRLSRPTTARWFATVASAEARKRHGGAWPVLIALWALVGGVLQALAVFGPK
jgi:hypothetical protein